MANNVVISFQAETEGLKPAVDILYKIGKITDDDVKAFNKANTAQKEMAATAAKNVSSYDKLATSVNNVKKNIIDGSINKAIEGTAKLTDKATQQTKVYDNSIRGLKQQYKDLISLAIQAGESSPIGQQALRDAGELRDRIGDLQQTTKNYGSDTATFDAIGQGIATIGAGFQAAEGAQALFGEGNEELQKRLVKLQAIMALTNGLQQIQNNLQAESALRLKLSAAYQAVYTTVVGASTGAMKLFRIALASTGIGLIVIALAALIANFDSVVEAVKKFIGRFEILKPVIEAVTKAFNFLKEALGFGDKLSDELKKLEAYQNAVIASYQDQQKRIMALRKSQGLNTLEFEKKTNDLLIKEQKKLFDLQLQMLHEKSQETGEINKEMLDKLAEDTKNFLNITNELEVRNNDILFEQQQRGLQARKNQIDARLQFVKKGGEAELKLRLNQIDNELAIENSQRDKIPGQVALNEAKANLARKQAFEDFKNYQIQAQIDVENKKLAVVQQGSLEELNLRRRVLDLELEMTLNNSKLTQEQKELKAAEAAQKELDLIKKYGDAQVSLAEQIELKKQSVGKDRLQKYTDDLDAEFEYYNQIAELEFQSSNQSYNRIEDLRRTKFKNAISLLDAELAKVYQTNDSVRASEEKLQRELAEMASKDPANRQQYELAIVESQERITASEQQTADEIVKINREKNLKIIADDNEAAANKKQLLQQQTQTYQDLANQSAAIIIQANDLELQNTLNNLNAETQANEEALKTKSISEDIYQKNKAEIERKEKEAKKKAFEENKKIQLAQVFINTAASAIKTASELGYPAAIPFVALAIAAGGLQALAIEKQQYPGFAKGTKYAPKGWAWVGEKGPELVSLKGGEEIKTAKESKSFAQTQYEKEYFNANTLSGSVDSSPVLSKKGQEATQQFMSEPGFALDYNLLTGMISKGVGEQIRKIPLTNLSFDRRGFTASVQEGSNTTNYFDNRFSTN